MTECKHGDTNYLDDAWPTGEAIEVCKNCGMSRAHWEQGESNWIMVDIETERARLQQELDYLKERG